MGKRMNDEAYTRIIRGAMASTESVGVMKRRIMTPGKASESAVHSIPIAREVMRLYLSAARVRSCSPAPKFCEIIGCAA